MIQAVLEDDGRDTAWLRCRQCLDENGGVDNVDVAARLRSK
jgi:hypothetical protein